MNDCSDLHPLLQDRVDGALPAAETRLLDAHLRDCAACRDEERRLRELVDGLSGLRVEEAPARDLWPGLHARLEAAQALAEAPTETDHSWLRLAAAAVLLAGLVGTFALLRSPGGGESAADGPAPPAVVDEYARASEALLRTLESRRSELSPDTLNAIDENLALLESALRRSREAMQSAPNDHDLFRVHHALLGRKTSVLRQLATMPSGRASGASASE